MRPRAAHLHFVTSVALDQIDEKARGLARAALAGEIGEHEARSGICELLLVSRVSESVARYPTGLSVQQRVDLAENLLSLLVCRVLDAGSQFDLERVANGSLCGWARMLAVRVSRWDRAVRPVGQEARTWLVSPLVPAANDHLTLDGVVSSRGGANSPTVGYHAAQAFGGLSVEEMVLSEWEDSGAFSDVLESAVNLTGFARAPARGRAGAAALRSVLGLPALCVPDLPAERAGILRLVQADEALARRSLVQMASMVCTEPPTRPAVGEAPVGELLLSLWDDFEPVHLESLMVRPAKAAHLVAVDALTPLSKPSREMVREMTRAVRAASPAKAWVAVQDGLVAAFLATCTEAVSEFDDTNIPEEKARKEELARAAAARWPVLVARVAVFPGAPLGRSVEQVAGRLRDLLDAERERDSQDRIVTRSRRGLGRGKAA